MVDESQATQFVATHQVPLRGEQPVLLHGGALLGVVLNKPSSMGEQAACVQWDMKGGGPVHVCAAFFWLPLSQWCALGHHSPRMHAFDTPCPQPLHHPNTHTHT